MRIEYRLSLRDVLFFQVYQFDHSPTSLRQRRKALLAGVAVIVALTGAMALFAQAWVLAAVGVVFGALYLFLYPQLLRQNIRRATVRMFAGKLNVLDRRVLEIQPDGLLAIANDEETLTPWNEVSGVKVLDRYVFAYLGEHAAHIVPRDAMLSGDFAAFAEEIRRRVPAVAASAR